jgi:hypothetical protein
MGSFTSAHGLTTAAVAYRHIPRVSTPSSEVTMKNFLIGLIIVIVLASFFMEGRATP